MSYPPNEGPLYDQSEVARILRRTAELQGGRADGPSTGLSLEEIKELAQDTGLDPALVSAAVGEMQAQREAGRQEWWGGPTTVVVEQELPADIDDATWERMLDRIRTQFGETGEVELRGMTREWTQKVKDGNQSQVSVRSLEGRTSIRIFRSVPVLATLLYIFLGIGTFISGLITLKEAASVLVGLPIWLACIAAVFFLVRWVIQRNATAERQRAATLMSELTTLVVRSSPRKTPTKRAGRDSGEAARETASSRIELPDDEGAGTDRQESAGRDRRGPVGI